MGLPAFCLTLVAVALLFPEDFLLAVDTAALKLRLLFLNFNLLIRSYIIYHRLKADFRRMHIPAPPFRFVPIQHRN